MGSGSSRQRTRPQYQPSYPPPPGVYHQQILPPPFYPDPHAGVNNGHYFGGGGMWRPPYPSPAGFPQPAQFRPPTSLPPQHTPAPTTEVQQTATIRNAVNLKKASLGVVPLPGNPNHLAIRFFFDASEACSVTTFVVVTEEPSKGCQLTPLKPQHQADAVLYEKGLGHRYPKPGAPDAIIDVGLYEERQLTSADKDTFPLVIRLETVNDKGRAESHSLQELRPGGAQKVWVQSQTTFAALARDEEGRWVVRVLKQKIWVDDVSYELQEIYGMENSAAAPQRPSSEKQGAGMLEENEERLCVICLVNERDTTVLPCRHMCMCDPCSAELRKQTQKCPICRNHVESMLHIKVQKPAAGHKQQVDSSAAVAGAMRDLNL